MTTPMSTDLEAQAQSASRISALADKGQTILGQMQGHVDVLQTLWKGQGSQSFQVGSTDIHAQLQKSQAALQDVSVKVNQNNTGYDSADTTNASSLSSTGL